MDPKSHHWTKPGPGRPPQRPREREDYHRPAHPHQGTGTGHHPPAPNVGDAIAGHYPPPPDPRERERQWSHQDPRYRVYLTSPPPSRPPLDFSLSSYSTPHSRTAYDRPHSTMGYIRPEPQHSRPHSRFVHRNWLLLIILLSNVNVSMSQFENVQIKYIKKKNWL